MPDLLEGAVFGDLDDAVRNRDRVGIPTLIGRAQAAVVDLRGPITFMGFSLGASAAEFLAAGHPAAAGAVLMHGALPLPMVFAERWRANVPVVVHAMADDPWVDPAAVVAMLAGLGVDRVLTSGGAARAVEGTATLKAMVAASGGVQVMAGGGVSVCDVPSLVALGVDAVHLSAKRAVDRRSGSWVSLGAATTSGEQDTHFVTDGAVVAAAHESLQLAQGPRRVLP